MPLDDRTGRTDRRLGRAFRPAFGTLRPRDYVERLLSSHAEYAAIECGFGLETYSGERATLETAIGAYYARHEAYPAGVEDLVGNELREPPLYHDVHGDALIVVRPGAGCE